MEHLMLDLETTGTEPGCGILSIAAIPFNLETGETGTPFTVEIDHPSCLAAGLQDSENTLQWWNEQDAKVRAIAFSGQTPLHEALTLFLYFFEALSNDPIYVWANSPSFDIAILKHALKVCNLPNPFNSFLERDYRTHISFAPHLRKSIPFEGCKHIPLNDALHQVKVATSVWKLCHIPLTIPVEI